MNKQKVYWAWTNKRSKIAHCYALPGYESLPICGTYLPKWYAKRTKALRRCKNCERTLES